MPRFFFHFRKPGRDLRDRDGILLADAVAARREAALAMGDFFQRSREVVDPAWQGWSIEVCDESGRRVCSLAFADAGRLAAHDVRCASGERASPRVVFLRAERARRQLSSEATRTRQLVERTSMLLDCSRYEAKALHCLQKTADSVRGQSRDLLERSRRQTATGSSWDTQASS